MSAEQKISVEKDTISIPLSTRHTHTSSMHEASRVKESLSSLTNTKNPSHHTEASSEKKTKGKFVTRLLESAISVSLTALFFGLPIFFTGMTLQGLAFEKELYFYFWLLLALVSWVSLGVIAGDMKIRKTPLDIPIALFVIVYIISAAVSVDRWHSFWGAFGDPSRGVLSIVSVVVAYYLILSHFTVKRMYLMLTGLLTAAFIVMAWSLLIISGIHFLPVSIEQHASFSLLGSLTALMIFLGGCLPLFIATIALVQSLPHKTKAFKTFLTTVLSIGIVLSLVLLFLLFPYVTWFAVIIGFAFFLLYILAQVVKMDDRLAWIPMLVFVVLLALYMIGSVDLLKVTLPLEATPNFKLSWEVAKESVKANMFFGSGPATYGYDFSLYRPQEYNQQPLSGLRFNQGTGIYAESIASIGLIGVIALTILILSFMSIGLFLLAQKKGQTKFLSLGLWSMTIVSLMAALMTQFNGSILIISSLVAALSLAVLMYESHSEETYLSFSLQSSPKFALALAFVFLVVSAGVAFTFAFIGKAFWSDVLAAQAMSMPVGNTEGVSKMTQATKYMPQESHYTAYLGQIYLTMAIQESNKAEKDRNTDALKQYVQSANGLVALAHDMSPNDIVIQEMLAQTYENTLFITGVRQDLLDALQKAYERASTLEPHNPVYYVKLGQIKKTQAGSAKGDDQKTLLSDAKALFQKSIDEKSDFMAGYFNLGLVQEASGDVDAAIVSLAKGISIDKTSKDAGDLKYNLARLLRVRGKTEDLALSEALLNDVLTVNDKSLNALLTLALVYEQTDRKDDAIKTYQRILPLITGDNSDASKKQIQTFIDNVKAGKSNATAPSAGIPSNDLPPASPTSSVPNPADVQRTQPAAANTPPQVPANIPNVPDQNQAPLGSTTVTP